MDSRTKLQRNEEFWKNKKIVVVLNLADDSIYNEVLRRSHSRAEGKERKRCIRAALRIQNFLSCPVENLVAIIVNQGEYPTWRREAKAIENCVRWQLLSLQDAKAIRIE